MTEATAIIIAALQAATAVAVAYLAHRTALLARQVKDVERATNGITQQLVSKAEEAGHARGVIQGRSDTQPPQSS